MNCAGQCVRSFRIEIPDCRHMYGWYDERVSEYGRIFRKEGDSLIVAVDLANIEVVLPNYRTEWTFRVVCKHGS